MTLAGWIIMTTSITGITLATAWCLWKVLITPGATEHVHGFEIQTPDEREDQG